MTATGHELPVRSYVRQVCFAPKSARWFGSSKAMNFRQRCGSRSSHPVLQSLQTGCYEKCTKSKSGSHNHPLPPAWPATSSPRFGRNWARWTSARSATLSNHEMIRFRARRFDSLIDLHVLDSRPAEAGLALQRRHRRQQLPRVFVLRVAVDGLGARLLHDAPFGHHQHLVADVLHHCQIMGNEEIREPQLFL
jgi:hypothetical protein